MDVTDLVYINSAGYFYADYPTFQAFVISLYQGIYGADVYLGSDSQDGQWLGDLAQMLYDSAAVGASNYAARGPTGAQGVGLSTAVQLNGLQRRGQTFSTVELTIGGSAFSTIENGIALDDLNQLWDLPALVTIPMSGTITVTATADQANPQASAEPNTINSIYTPTQGWQTINNEFAATVGVPTETDAQLRVRQSISTSIPAQTVFDATIGAVGNAPGVTAIAPYENDTDITDGNGLPPHSISLVVEGGTDTEIAQTILDYKTPGTNTYGTTSVPLVDPKGVPITINFFRPFLDPIAVQVTLTPLASWISSNETIIADALAAYISSIKIGGTIVLTQLYAVAYVPSSTAAGSFNIEGIELAQTATGTITFTGNPSPGDTVTVNSISIQFVSSSPTGNEVLIGLTANDTAANLQAFLDASIDSHLIVATYSVVANVVTVTYGIPGPAGDAFTLAESSASITVSGATLSGGAFASADIDLPFNVLATCNATEDVSFIT